LFQLFFYSIPKLFGREQKVLESGPAQAAELFDPLLQFDSRPVELVQDNFSTNTVPRFSLKNSLKILQ
jgi:hypothetical protein